MADSMVPSKLSPIKENKFYSMGKQVEILEQIINYEVIGNGAHHLFFMPGTLGFSRLDFAIQLETFDRDRFTLISWDPPGYGYSRPPDRSFPVNFHHRDAHLALHLLKHLGVRRTSVVAWSGGGTTAYILAAENPELVEKLVVFGAGSYITAREVKIAEAIRDMNTWNEAVRGPFLKMYDEEVLSRAWSSWFDAIKLIFATRGGNVCKEHVKRITCPTLILHGNKDPVLTHTQVLYLKENIPNSKLVEWADAKHNLHQEFPEKFKTLVESFLFS